MSSDTKAPDKRPQIPRPPSKEDLDEVSREQAMITDEWSGPSPAPPEPERKPG